MPILGLLLQDDDMRAVASVATLIIASIGLLISIYVAGTLGRKVRAYLAVVALYVVWFLYLISVNIFIIAFSLGFSR